MPHAGNPRGMQATRRRKALVTLVVAVAAVVLFGLGVTLCIDWGGASAPPGFFGQSAALVLAHLQL